MHLVGLLVIVVGLVAGGSCTLSDLVAQFKAEFDIFHKTGVQTDSFLDIISKYALSDETRNNNLQSDNVRLPRPAICTFCTLAVTTVLDAHALGEPTEAIAAIAVDLCISLNIQPARICQGVIDLNVDVMAFVLDNAPLLSAHRVCAMAFQGDGCGRDEESLEWSINLGDTPKPTHVRQNSDHSSAKAEPINIIQITDIHHDPTYLVGGNADCGEPMCCRADQGLPEMANATAGRWGDYRSCDTPWEVVVDAFAQIKEQHQQIDYIYMTGDLVDHGVWDTTRSKNNETLVKINREMKNTFGDIPVFPCLGNHEPNPLNVFAPTQVPLDENISSAWLYETLADLWSAWLPAETRETILRGGYYTVLVRPGFRVVALNNMQCYGNNWFLIYDQNDPDGQLQWLADVLLKAETDGEKVHLLYHIPPGGGDCYYRWSREFNRIINRFESTVTGQFSGHTHNDEFHIFYSKEEPERPINVLFTGGSLTAYTNVNPNYRIYSVDADDWNVIDHETWIYNMTAANLSPSDKLDWYKMYSFKDAYGVTSLDPVEMDRLVHAMVTDEDLLQQYFRFYNLNGDPKLEQGCDADCSANFLCSIVTSDSSSSTQCDQILELYNSTRLDLY